MYFYKSVLLVILVTMPFFIVCFGNRFQSAQKTAIRMAIAVLAVWAYVIAMRFIIVPVDLALATTPEQAQAAYHGDGAKNAFALVFGWVPGIMLAGFAWVCGRVWRWIHNPE